MSATKPRIPETVSISELAENMAKSGKVQRARAGAQVLRERLARESLGAGRGDPAVAVKAGADYPGFMRLRCEEVDLFDRNPRTSVNPRYVEIRDSIIERGGLQGPLTVTRRPGSERYMLYMGGNTRLQIVRELWRETRDARYEWLNFTYHEWVSEADVIAAHLIENEARSDTTFFEKAGGLAALKEELEKGRGKALALRDLSAEAKRLGMKVSPTAAMNYLFAVAELAALGPALTHENVNAIRAHPRAPRKNRQRAGHRPVRLQGSHPGCDRCRGRPAGRQRRGVRGEPVEWRRDARAARGDGRGARQSGGARARARQGGPGRARRCRRGEPGERADQAENRGRGLHGRRSARSRADWRR